MFLIIVLTMKDSNTAKSQVPGHIGQLVPNMKFKVFDADSGKEVTIIALLFTIILYLIIVYLL